MKKKEEEIEFNSPFTSLGSVVIVGNILSWDNTFKGYNIKLHNVALAEDEPQFEEICSGQVKVICRWLFQGYLKCA